MIIQAIHQQLRNRSDPERANNLQRFFKTGPGEYGEGDQFLGIRVPVLRQIARKSQLPDLDELESLMVSPVHEERFVALMLLIRLFRTGDSDGKKRIYNFYLAHTRYINNWDLVDCSAEHIVGAWLWDRDRSPLTTLAKSDLLWERRIAIIATFHFIKRLDFSPTLEIGELLLGDREDLIHKAVGWMLREVGNRSRTTEESFLKKHYTAMPRTALRYAIEKFPENRRQEYLKGKI
ncbi:MAG: DNA alkylation repair protein [FCB group bacterium]|nr:DNA alkylation repair protein [FCB group bacterium]